MPRLAICNTILSGDAGQLQGPQLTLGHRIMRVHDEYTYNHSVPIQLFCFSLSVQYSINYIKYSTLYYKIGFVLDDFAQAINYIKYSTLYYKIGFVLDDFAQV